ncbi:MAG TPA: NAD(P)-dependent oxidoreductase, partial [Burkholderiales bacterium]|nr:NAD(P)-dependent oxidoreductase [Burkholderiales bacterium]
STAMNVGFVGLGQMGRPMVERLKGAGHRVQTWNRTRISVDIHDTPEAVLDSDVVVTMLADDTAVRAVWLDSGLAQRLPRGAVHLNMATVSMRIARELTSVHGESYVAAPVFGRPPLAGQGQLDIIAAGPEAALSKCDPLFRDLGKQVFIVGADPAAANAVKIARNFLLAAMIESLGEAFALVRKCGVAPADFLNVIANTSLGSPAYRNYGKLIVDQAWRPAQFTMPLGLKDVELALATAKDAGMDLQLGHLVRNNLLAAIVAGRAEQDWAALAGHIAAEAGL